MKPGTHAEYVLSSASEVTLSLLCFMLDNIGPIIIITFPICITISIFRGKDWQCLSFDKNLQCNWNQSYSVKIEIYIDPRLILLIINQSFLINNDSLTLNM